MQDRWKRARVYCACDSGAELTQCCQPILDGARALTAQALMRSRYTAFTQRNATYLLYSWHPDTRPQTLDFDPAQRWLGLKIKHTEGGAAVDEQGIVCFAARYKIAGRGARLEECSRFVRLATAGDDAERWVYVGSVD